METGHLCKFVKSKSAKIAFGIKRKTRSSKGRNHCCFVDVFHCCEDDDCFIFAMHHREGGFLSFFLCREDDDHFIFAMHHLEEGFFNLFYFVAKMMIVLSLQCTTKKKVFFFVVKMI